MSSFERPDKIYCFRKIGAESLLITYNFSVEPFTSLTTLATTLDLSRGHTFSGDDKMKRHRNI